MEIQGHKLLFKAIVGSHAYGTNVEGSDIDHKGIYIQSPENVLINGYVPQIEVGKDETYYEVGRFIDLCETANPTVLELLYSPVDCIVYKDPAFDIFFDNAFRFLTKKCRHSFGGYAVQQIIKAKGLDKKMNWEKEKTERKDILDFCYVHQGCGSVPVKEWLVDKGLEQKEIGLVALPHMRYCYGLYFDRAHAYEDFKPRGIAQDLLTSNEVSLTSIPIKMAEDFYPFMLYFNKDGYSSHCADYKEYQNWLKNRNVQRYVDVDSHGQKIDGKNMLHCMRLLETAMEIPTDKMINIRRPNKDYLIGIRKGKYDLTEILEVCEGKLKLLDDTYIKSDLPDSVDSKFVRDLKIQIRKEIYDRSKRIKEVVY